MFKHTFIISLFLTSVCSITQAQNTPIKLEGRVIGTKQCVDYDNGNQLSYTVNTAANAFDGKLDNMFATYQRSGGWAGLDLGEKHVITQVAYCPREIWSTRLQLGVFEGANDPTFIDAIPLFIIPDIPQQNRMTIKDVSCSRGFRYVRYVGPNDVRCNIAELAFYGYKAEGDDSRLMQLTNLPTVSIHTIDAEDIIEKKKKIRGTIKIISENGSHFLTEDLEIRGRGNASWNFPKKPYRFKLDNKAEILGMPAIKKKWTLINNYGDKTLARNLLAFDLSQRFEMTYTPAGKAVDLLLNGEYKGTYQLCDQIEVNDGRVEINEMKTTDITLPKLSGGYLLEIDAYAADAGYHLKDIAWFESSQKRIPVTIKSPADDEIVPEQTAYIKEHFNKMEKSLFASNYYDPINGYRKYIDVESFVRQFLIGEISGNTDAYWSVYLYKKRNDDIFYFGPVWDFDIAYENDNRTYPINNTSNWLYASKGSEAHGMRSFVNRLMSDSDFLKDVQKVYVHYRDNGTITPEALTEVVDQYADELEASQELNFTRWKIMNQYVHQNPRVWGSYKNEVENVRNYIIARLNWIDKKLKYTYNSTQVENKNNIFTYTEKGILHITGIQSSLIIQIYDLSGREILSRNVNSDISFPLETGIYIIHLNGEDIEPDSRKCMIP